MHRHLLTFLQVAWAAGWIAMAPPSHAAEQGHVAEEAAIRAASQAYMTALGASDVDTIVEFWTPVGTFVDVAGDVHLAREMAAREFSGKTKAKEPQELRHQATHHPATSIRLTTPQVAIEQSKPGDEGASTSFLAIWVKQDERWRLDYFREIAEPVATTSNPLEELDWLIGKWQAEEGGPAATLEAKWIDDKRFILQEFTVQTPNEGALRVQQRIGWDPASNQIRSWLFRSDGGFEEGVWDRAGDVWVVKKVGVLPDGEKTSTVNFWTHEAPASCWFKTLQARVGDQHLEDVVVRLLRVPAP